MFPEGERGFVKPYTERYQLQRFGLGFMRLALETDTPIVPVGIVGSEEQSPGLLRSRWLGSLVGAPVAPITLTFPWLGLASFLPLPVKFRLHFGECFGIEIGVDDYLGKPYQESQLLDAIEPLVLARRRQPL